MDFVLAIVPWLFLGHVQMKTPEKVGPVISMSLGVLLVNSLNYLT